MEILFEDEDLVIVNKPSGVLSIPDRFNASKPNLLAQLKVRYPHIFVVHRLDAETSGIICFAKHEQAHQHLNLQFEHRTVEKIYLALADGKIMQDNGTIDAGIEPHPTVKGKMITSKRGKPSLTLFQVVERFKHFTLVEANLKTGRTHQVRVHFASIGHSLAVDTLYGKRTELFLSEVKLNRFNLGKFQEERPIMNRTTLHAHRLKLKHPTQEVDLEWTAPPPKDFRALLQQLEKWGK
jgi:23S rRNA pseudouridine955/2504/2580 synthase/23S rRNA pseudouridine1911/1915/1917 synthase